MSRPPSSRSGIGPESALSLPLSLSSSSLSLSVFSLSLSVLSLGVGSLSLDSDFSLSLDSDSLLPSGPHSGHFFAPRHASTYVCTSPMSSNSIYEKSQGVSVSGTKSYSSESMLSYSTL